MTTGTPSPSPEQQVRRHAGLAAALALTALVLLAACGGTDDPNGVPAAAEPTVTTTVPDPVTPRSGLVDEHVAVEGGARLHVRCSGTGTTTVVLISGFEEVGDSWTSVRPALADRTRVCSYERFGIGTSDPAPAPQTFTTQADDLRTVLDAVGEPGPYVVVGHSYGGAEAVMFASRFRDDVTGLVLLDATPVAWPATACTVEDDGSEAAASFQASCAQQAPGANAERLDIPVAFAEVAAIESLDDLPMVVARPAEREYPGLDPREAARLEGVWNEGQDGWVDLSSAARLVTVDGTGHYIQLDQARVVITEVERLLP